MQDDRLNQALAHALGFRADPFTSWDGVTGYTLLDGHGKAVTGELIWDEIRVWYQVPDWSNNVDAALSMVQDYIGRPYILRYNPMIQSYTFTILNIFGAKAVDESGETAALAICNAVLMWFQMGCAALGA